MSGLDDLSPEDQAEARAILAGDQDAAARLSARLSAWFNARFAELDAWSDEAAAWLARNERPS